jgi:two-component system torCAD operon response regulator TorR
MSLSGAKAHILLIEDDEGVREMVADYLDAYEFEVTSVSTRAEAEDHLTKNAFDLVIVDVGLPDGDGISIARQLSQSGDLGIIILSGRTDLVDRVVGIEAGADDYVTKPVEPRELLARLRAVQRRRGTARAAHSAQASAAAAASSGQAELVRFGEYTLNPVRRTVTDQQGRPVRLTSAEQELLLALAAQINSPVHREALYQRVFDRAWRPDDRAIDRLVTTLRRKLGDNRDFPQIIMTIRGRGYQLAGRRTGAEAT